jgi:hypothetical protein
MYGVVYGDHLLLEYSLMCLGKVHGMLCCAIAFHKPESHPPLQQHVRTDVTTSL